MKGKLTDMLVIVGAGLITFILNHFGLLEQYASLALIPFLAFYFLGKYIGSKEIKTSKN